MAITRQQQERLNALFRRPRLKKFMVIELPPDEQPPTLAAIGELCEIVSRHLRALGVDPVRTRFLCAESIDVINGGN